MKQNMKEYPQSLKIWVVVEDLGCSCFVWKLLKTWNIIHLAHLLVCTYSSSGAVGTIGNTDKMAVITIRTLGMVSDSPCCNNFKRELTYTMSPSHEEWPMGLKWKTAKTIVKKGGLVLVTCVFENLDGTICVTFPIEMVQNCNMWRTWSHSGYSYKDDSTFMVFNNSGVYFRQVDSLLHKWQSNLPNKSFEGSTMRMLVIRAIYSLPHSASIVDRATWPFNMNRRIRGNATREIPNLGRDFIQTGSNLSCGRQSPA